MMKGLILAAGALAVAQAGPGGKTPPGGSRQGGGLSIGSVLSPTQPGYQIVDRTRHNLPVAPAGYDYVRVGRHAYLRHTHTGVVAGVFRDAFR